jgi:hypothetical protein
LDSTGNVYVGGRIESAGLATTGAFQTLLNGPTDAFVAKYASDGARLAFTYLGGSGVDGGGVNDCMEIDAQGRIVISGQTMSTDFPFNPSNPLFTQHSNDPTVPSDPTGQDGFVAVLNSDLTILYFGSYLGGGAGKGTDREEPSGVAIDPQNNVYLSGETKSADFITTPNAADQIISTSGDHDAFLMKLYWRTGGMLLYSSFMGGDILSPSMTTEPGSRGRGLIFRSSDNTVLLCGQTTTTDFPTTINSLFPVFPGLREGFVTIQNLN